MSRLWSTLPTTKPNGLVQPYHLLENYVIAIYGNILTGKVILFIVS